MCVVIHWAIALQWQSSVFPFSIIIGRIDSIMLMERILHTLNDVCFKPSGMLGIVPVTCYYNALMLTFLYNMDYIVVTVLLLVV